MSWNNREPEYRRRIRKKAAKDQHKAANERYEASQSSYVDKIVAAINTIYQHYYRETHKEHTRKKWDRFWEVMGVIGLWLAAGVGATAIWIGTNDASKQRNLMRDQSNVMNKTLVMSERPWLYIKGNINFSNVQADKNIGFVASADVQNSGNTIATNTVIAAQIKSVRRTDGFPIHPKDIPCGYPTNPLPIFQNLGPTAAVLPKREQNISFSGSVVANTLVANPSRRLGPYLVGCIQYKWPGSDQIFDTWFYVAISLVNVRQAIVAPNVPPLNIVTFRATEDVSYIDAD